MTPALTPALAGAADVLAQPNVIAALTSATIEILTALSRPESTATLALLALVLLLAERARK